MRQRQRVYNTYEYVLKDVAPGTTRGKYIGVGGRYTSDFNKARVFTGAYLNDIYAVDHRPWRENFKAVELKD